MKIIFYISLVLISSYCFAQTNSLNNGNLNPGIYLTLDDILKNRPINIPNLYFEKDSVKNTRNWKLEYLDIYHLKISGEQIAKTESIGGILGFCDGKNIYLSASYNRSTTGTSFFKAEQICHFLYYEGLNFIYVNSRPHFYDEKGHYTQNIIDLNKKELIFGVNNRKFKKIISGNIELIDKFKNEEDKVLVYKEYLKKYCEE